jgi:hypothetical protein
VGSVISNQLAEPPPQGSRLADLRQRRCHRF